MIRLKPLLKEDPDKASYYYSETEWDSISFDSPKATAFYVIKNKVYLSKNGETHIDIVNDDISHFYNLVKNDSDIKDAVKNLTSIPLQDFLKLKLDRYIALDFEDQETFRFEVKEAVKRIAEFRGRYWNLRGKFIQDVKDPYLVAFWDRPNTNSKLIKCLRLLKLPIDRCFVDESGYGMLSYPTPALEYEKPRSPNTPEVDHTLPPHRR